MKKKENDACKRLLSGFMVPPVFNSGTKIDNPVLVLTETEQNEIRRTLREEASKEKIEAFIHHLDFFCIAKKAHLEQSPKTDIRATRECILIDCKAAQGHLKQIERGKMVIWHDENIDHFGAGNDPGGDFLVEILGKAREAVGSLEKFIKVFERYHQAEVKKIGRPGADSDHFIRKIKDLYIKYIGKPTTYEKGAFFTLVKMILEILKLPCEDPSRTIKAALKNK